MKLKLVKAPRPGQKDMTCHTAAGTFSMKVGETKEVSDVAGAELLVKHTPKAWSFIWTRFTTQVE